MRSSATAEDLPGTSFAGQQDTYLHIAGAPAVLDAVRRCWASLWTGRAIAYRHTQGFAHEAVALAVVVQEMFPSEVAGVLFTANPVTSNPFELFLNASWGLGEAIVSGHVNPDQLIVAKPSFEVVDRQINDKLVMTVPAWVGPGFGHGPCPRATADPSRPSRTTRCASCVPSGSASRTTTASPRTSSGAGPTAASPSCRPGRSPGANLDFGHELEMWKTPKALASMYDDQWVWSRAYSDEVQTGPSTPSFYTYLQARHDEPQVRRPEHDVDRGVRRSRA